MNLETDAISCTETANLAKDKINVKLLSEIEKNLDRQEKISIIFLTIPTEILPNAYEVISDLLEKNEDKMIFRWMTEFNIQNWEEKLLESLLIIQNYEILTNLGFSDSEQELFQTQLQIQEREISPNLNRVLKTLYFLCDELDDDNRKLLVKEFKENDIQQEELELYLLFWIKMKCISVSDSSGNLKLLLANLKKINFDIDSSIYLSLENWNEKEKRREISKEISRNMQDAMESLGNSLPNNDDSIKETVINKKIENKCPVYEFKKGLCVIINEEKFDYGWHERIGSQKDIQKLRQTFENFGYEIEVSENLSFVEIQDKLKIVGNYSKNEYDCIILCIMSHGQKKTIATRDGKLISLEGIRDMICTPRLKNVVKICLVQACQGEFLGFDTTDGSSSEEISHLDSPVEKIHQLPKLRDNFRFADSVMFVATIPSFKSIRNTKEGSWFIQAICNVLESEERISWNELALRVKHQVANERGEIREKDLKYQNIVQIAETIDDTLIKDFIFQRTRNLSS